MIYSLEGESPQPSLLPLRRVLPFTDGAISFLLWAFVGWVVFVGMVSAFRPRPIWVLRRSGALAMFARWLLNWLQNFIVHVPDEPVIAADQQQQAAAAVAARFAPAQHALRATPQLVVAFVLIYVGAAVVIGPQPLRLSKDLTTLSDMDLCEWSILNGSALATSFAALVAPASPARQTALAADPWWLASPTVDASFAHVRSRAPNNRRGCPAGSTVKYLVTFPSVAAGAFRDTPGMCGLVQAVSPKGRHSAVAFNVGIVFTAAGHSGVLADAAAAARLRRMVTELNRRLRLELRDPTVIQDGQAALEAVCPTTSSLVDVDHLERPVLGVLGFIAVGFFVLALGVPWLLDAATVADGAPDVEDGAPDGEAGAPDGEAGAPGVGRGTPGGEGSVAADAAAVPLPPAIAPAGDASRVGRAAASADAGRGGTRRRLRGR